LAKDRIKILGEWSAWAEPVRQGQLVRPDGESVWVLIRPRPELEVDSEGFAQIKQEGRLMARIDHPSVLRLLHVTKVENQPAWVYEGAQAVSLARVIDVSNAQSAFLPVRAAIEVVERVVQGIRAAFNQGCEIQGAAGSIIHCGPAPSEVLVDAVGAVRVAGFSLTDGSKSRIPAPSGYGPANAGTPEEQAAYGVGALLVHLLGGERPVNPGRDANRQDAVVRRAMIRVLSRPGEPVPSAITDLIRQALSYESEDRLSLTDMQDILSETARTLESPALRTWASATVPGLLAQQEHGFPDPDTARKRRHIEATDDSSSFAPPPVRKRVPREVPTMVGLPSVDPKSIAMTPLSPYEADPNEATPYIGSLEAAVPTTGSLTGGYPTAETDIASIHSVNPTGMKAVEPIPMEIGNVEDTWDADPLEDPDRLGGWPLLAGLVIGMVVAVSVGVFVVDHMTMNAEVVREVSPAPDPASAPASAPEPIPEPEPVPEPEPIPEPEVDVEPVPEAAPAPPPPTRSAPAPVPARRPTTTAKKKPPPPPPPVPSEFTVTFRSVDPSIDRMVVRCHKGGTGEGAQVVHIVRAGKGPCAVVGYRGEAKNSVSVVITGPENYSCFKGGARICE
jgi:hypothetical protein